MTRYVLLIFAAAVIVCGCAPRDVRTDAQGAAWRPAFAKRSKRLAADTGSGAVAPSRGDVVVSHLDNGLTVIVKPTRTAPVVCVRAYVRAGAMLEKEWLGCGLSHLSEHLVARESIHRMPGGGASQTARDKRAGSLDIGGQANAYTTMDHTCYYIAAASEKTMQCVDLIAGQMIRPEITQADFDREHGVVQRELEMRKDDPNRQMWYEHMANSFGTHPAAVPTIGFLEPLKAVTRDDVLKYVRRMYVPQNMIFVVVGDVDAEAVIKRVKRRFGDLPRGRTPDLSLPPVPTITGLRLRTVTNKNIRDVMERISFQTIPLVHEDLYALDVLSYILSRGRSSRLVRKLQFEKSLVTNISTGSWTPAWGKGLFTVSFRAEVGKFKLAEKAALAELRAVVSGGVTSEELAKAKRQKLADLVRGRQTAESLSAQLATDYLSTGDVDFSRNYTNRIQRVTAGDVLAVAKKYFTFDRMVITRMVPESLEAQTTIGARKTDDSTATVFTLPNGLRVVMRPSRSAGLVAMTFMTKGGLLAENEKTNGIGSLMMSLTTRGAGERSGNAIASFFDEAGGGISGRCGNNTFYWRASVPADRFDGALDIFADVVQKPTLDGDQLDKLRPLAISAIKQVDERWTSQLFKFFHRRFFTGSPYRLHSGGTADIVESVTAAQIREYHARMIRANGSVLTIYGDFDVAAAKERVKKLFASLPSGKFDPPSVAARKVDAAGELYVLETTNAQAGIIVASSGMKVTNVPDRLAINVLDTIISGYRLPSGWLHSELRGKQLVYVVHAFNWTGLLPGAFVTYAGCQPDKAPQVVDIIRKNLRKASRYKPTQKEIDRAVNIILTADALGSQTMPSQSMSAATDELYGLGYDFREKSRRMYRKVTPEDVARVAKKYLGGGYVVIVTTPKPDLFKTIAPDKNDVK